MDKNELIRRWILHDTIVHACASQQALHSLDDEETLCMMVDLMAARHIHLVKAYEELLARQGIRNA